MSKAKKILKDFIYNPTSYGMFENMTPDEVMQYFKEALSELEAQDGNSCANCTYWEGSEDNDISNPRWCSKGISEGYTTSITDEDFCCNKHELKATK